MVWIFNTESVKVELLFENFSDLIQLLKIELLVAFMAIA